MAEHQGCYHIKVMQLFLFAEISRRWGDWGHIRNEKKAELLSAPHLAHHTLQSMQTVLTRTCGKTQGNRQKETHLQTHPRSLSVLGDLNKSLRAWDFSPPPSFLPGSHVWLSLPSVLHAVEHRAASGCRTSTRWQERLVEFYKKIKNKRKSEQKWVRLWFRQSSGTGELFSDSCFDFEISDFVCECVTILWVKQMSLVVLFNDTPILLYMFHTVAVASGLPRVTTCNHPFCGVCVWSAAAYTTCWMTPLPAAHHHEVPNGGNREVSL